MKNSRKETLITVIIFILIVVINAAVITFIAESYLPYWIKFWLLS